MKKQLRSELVLESLVVATLSSSTKCNKFWSCILQLHPQTCDLHIPFVFMH